MTSILTFISTGFDENGKIAVSFNWEQALSSAVNVVEIVLREGI